MNWREQLRAPRQGLGITARIIIPVFVLLAVSHLVVHWVTMMTLDQQLHDSSRAALATGTVLQEQHFKAHMARLQSELRFVADSAAMLAFSHDAAELTRQRQSQRRLASLFVDMLRAKPATTQMQLIATDGRELLRVDRLGEGGAIRVASPAQLVHRLESAYFPAVLGLPRGEVYLSDINLTAGSDIAAPRPVIQAAMAVRQADGQLFAVLVKSQALDANFTGMRQLLAPRHTAIASAQGEYLLPPEPGLLPEGQRLWGSLQDRHAGRLAVAGGDVLYQARQVHYGAASSPRHLWIVATEPVSSVLAPRQQLLGKVVLILILVLLVAAVLAWATARHIVRPLAALNRALNRGKLTVLRRELPQRAPREIAQLSAGVEAFSRALERRKRVVQAEIRERREIQRRLQAQNEKLSLANQELSQFAYIASHDLQEPLQTVRSFIALFRSHYESQLDERGGIFLNFMDESALRMSELIKGLLDYSQLGKSPDFQPVDCQLLLTQVIEDLGQRINEAGASIEVLALPTVRGSPVELRMLFQNLLANGIKFSRPGVAPQLTVSAEYRNGEYLFRVSDNGIGIAPDYLQRVFLIFQRLHARESYGGTGIGLAHCKKIIEAHGGQIWIESEPGLGSTFLFTLREVTDEEAR